MSRPLLPNIDTAEHASPQSTSDSLEPGINKPTYAKRGKITIVACVPCRKRKTKCDGKRPRCGQCAARDGNCAYDMTDEQRKLTYLRDQSDALQERQTELEGLINALQIASNEIAHDILRRIRSGERTQVVAEQVAAGRLLFDASRKHEHSPTDSSSAAKSPEDIPTGHLRTRIKAFDNLMKLLKDQQEDNARRVLWRIRRGENLTSILLSSDAGKLNYEHSNQSGSPRDLAEDWEQTRPFALLDGAGTLVTQSPSSSTMQGHPWTSVTDDSELIEHLMRLYFTWQHTFFQNFPEKLFRRDMAAGKTTYCSTALVNAVCCSGCFLSSREDLRKDREDEQSLISDFFDEAMASLNKLKANDAPNTAAMYLISYVEGYRGNPAGQWMLGGRSALMALDLNLNLRLAPHSPTSGSNQASEDEKTARSHAFWGCFHVMQLNSFTLGRLPVFSKDAIAVDNPPIDPDEDEEPWEAYEMTMAKRPGARSSTFHQCAKLSKLVNATQFMFYAPSEPLNGGKLLDTYSEYLEWHEQLPAMLTGSDPTPHILCLHMYYHAAILLLFRPFLKATIVNSSVKPREVCRQAADEISSIWQRHRQSFGLCGVWQFQVNCLLAACTIHVVNLPAIASTKALTEACNSFQELLLWQGWAFFALEALRTLVKKWSLVLPQTVEEALYRDINQPSSYNFSDSSSHPAPQHAARSEQSRGRSKSPRIETQGHMSHKNYVGAEHKNRSQWAPSQHMPQSDYHSRSTTSPKRQSRQMSNSTSSTGSQQKRQRIESPRHGPQQSPITEPSHTRHQSGSSSFRYPALYQGGHAPPSQLPAGIPPGWVQQHRAPYNPTQAAPGQPSSEASYLYNPFPGGQVPILYPTAKMQGPRQDRQQAGNQPFANGVSSSEPSRYQDHTMQGNRQRADTNGATPFDEALSLPGGVEGLSFADDWRDPYLSFQPPQAGAPPESHRRPHTPGRRH